MFPEAGARPCVITMPIVCLCRPGGKADDPMPPAAAVAPTRPARAWIVLRMCVCVCACGCGRMHEMERARGKNVEGAVPGNFDWGSIRGSEKRVYC